MEEPDPHPQVRVRRFRVAQRPLGLPPRLVRLFQLPPEPRQAPAVEHHGFLGGPDGHEECADRTGRPSLRQLQRQPGQQLEGEKLLGKFADEPEDAELLPQSETQFFIRGPAGVHVIFLKDAERRVAQVKVIVRGREFRGERQQ